MIKKKICLLGFFAVGKTSLVRGFVFESFSEKYLSTIGTKGEAGSGPGLSIVTRIMKTLNFKFDIQSEINKGTTFIILF